MTTISPRPSTSHKRLGARRALVYASLILPSVGSIHASRYLADWPARADYNRKLRVRLRTEEAALMAGYIVSGVVALAVTLYLFIALLFPERF